MSWKVSAELMETIRHYSKFPATGVSLRQMVQFGERPSPGMDCGTKVRWDWCANGVACIGTLFRASQFLSEELPIRLAHRVQELNELPDGLNEMPSIKRVQDWYAQSFEVIAPLYNVDGPNDSSTVGSYYAFETLPITRNQRAVDATTEAEWKSIGGHD
jgi:pyruvate dehydrogenase kinase 2/3/4